MRTRTEENLVKIRCVYKGHPEKGEVQETGLYFRNCTGRFGS